MSSTQQPISVCYSSFFRLKMRANLRPSEHIGLMNRVCSKCMLRWMSRWDNVLCRLFVLPQYCGTLLEQCLMLNRRRNNLEDVVKSSRGSGGSATSVQRAEQSSAGVNDVTADDSVSIVESIISETERLRIREGVHTRIYVCATMWHETANEMVQVLKSIMRYVTD